jgi:hypothetical protein
LKYVIEDGERFELDKHRHISTLSQKATHVQNVIWGVGQAIGGDDVQDLARLLRIPGPPNRKNQRNGQPPVPTELVECDESRRYPFSDFERFAATSPEAEREKKISVIPLPKPRKPTAAKSDKLSRFIAKSAAADVGYRSEADFAVCCFAIRTGIDKEAVWQQVSNVGKFAERSRDEYFERTWTRAEWCVKSETYEEVTSEVQPEIDDPQTADSAISQIDAICIDTETTPLKHTLAEITKWMLKTGDCFRRADQLVVISGDSIRPIARSSELIGLLSQKVEIRFGNEKHSIYRPLSTPYAEAWLNNHHERSRVPNMSVFTRSPGYTPDWRLIEPGYDEDSEIFYAGAPVTPLASLDRLDELLSEFCFNSPGDRTNYIGVLLTVLLVSHFIGSKPAVLFNGNQPGLGKSVLAQIIAVLRDGHATGTVTFNPNDEEFEKRLGAVVHRGATTIVIDNAKTRRNARIESPCLERLITDPVLSFRLLGYSQDIRVENSHIFAITANTPDVSRDLVTRSIVVNLFHEGTPERRRFSIPDPEQYAIDHRQELLGELCGMVERWKASGMLMAKVDSRFNKRGWGSIIGGILEANGQPDFLTNADEAAATLDETRREFAELIAIMADSPQGNWTAAELAKLCGQHKLLEADLGQGSDRARATKLGIIAGRFVAERFDLDAERSAVFRRSDGRKVKIYQVFLDDSAER